MKLFCLLLFTALLGCRVDNSHQLSHIENRHSKSIIEFLSYWEVQSKMDYKYDTANQLIQKSFYIKNENASLWNRLLGNNLKLALDYKYEYPNVFTKVEYRYDCEGNDKSACRLEAKRVWRFSNFKQVLADSLFAKSTGNSEWVLHRYIEYKRSSYPKLDFFDTMSVYENSWNKSMDFIPTELIRANLDTVNKLRITSSLYYSQMGTLQFKDQEVCKMYKLNMPALCETKANNNGSLVTSYAYNSLDSVMLIESKYLGKKSVQIREYNEHGDLVKTIIDDSTEVIREYE